MSDECIHGFENGVCAICNPKPVAVAAVPVKTASRTRASVPRGTTSRPQRTPSGTAPGVPSAVSIVEQRIYHLTHIRNLPSILRDGAIVAGADPIVDIAPETVRAERADASVGGIDDKALTEFVPFFLSPDAVLWQSLRAGAAHPRLSRDVVGADTADFIFLVSTIRQVLAQGRSFVVADGNSEGIATRFATTREDADRMLYRLRANSESEAILEAELLVEGSLPLEAVALIGVQNDKVRLAVRELLAEADESAKIAVYPPWFQPTE